MASRRRRAPRRDRRAHRGDPPDEPFDADGRVPRRGRVACRLRRLPRALAPPRLRRGDGAPPLRRAAARPPAPLRRDGRSDGRRGVDATAVVGWGGGVAERYVRFVYSAEPRERLATLPERVAGTRLAAG